MTSTISRWSSITGDLLLQGDRRVARHGTERREMLDRLVR